MEKMEIFVEHLVGDLLEKWKYVDIWRGVYEANYREYRSNPKHLFYLDVYYDGWKERLEDFEKSLHAVSLVRQDLIREIKEAAYDKTKASECRVFTGTINPSSFPASPTQENF